MTKEEFEKFYGDDMYPRDYGHALVLDNGVLLTPAADYEGNDTGALFMLQDNETYVVEPAP